MRGFGVYRSGASWLHRLDPRAKIVATLLFLVATVLAGNWWTLGVMAGAAALLWNGTGRRPSEAGHLLRAIAPLLGFIFVVNGVVLLAGHGQALGVAAAVGQAAQSAAFAVVKLACAVVGAATLMMSTDPERLTAAFVQMLRPFCRRGRIVDDYAFMLAATFRFVPLLSDEALRIRQAQASRGACFQEGGIVARVRAWVPVLVPLFASSMRRADNLAFAVASRGFFSPASRTSLIAFRWGAGDTFLCAIAVIVTLGVVSFSL